ncbi:PTS fructose transporter subunit IIC [Gemella sp. oral taxon 928]|uniref:PTS fructose transporter subunit IIABC n=2 Tax=Gemella TaxID=1378 RepID=UPI0007681F7D|nr:fructose-specific PTS transporter subunit EIIC [Gemella sp. oral taxon 928]AME08848.1 PTS fructose transporter subunit IIC [Gemella sp. oral taxon 928]
MKLTDVINFDLIQFNFSATDKQEALDKLTTLLVEKDIIANKKSFYDALMTREKQSTTGVGEGIAIPHAKSADFNKAMIIYAKSDTGVEWESFDGQPANHIFMICAPDSGADEHLKALASLSQALMDIDVKNGLNKATTKEEVEKVFTNFIAKTETTKKRKPRKIIDRKKTYIIAVTACPTGIAHTFMAAEKIKETAKEMGLEVKVETNGQIGIENKLTKDDINRATGVIVAADKKVETARFAGKPTIITKVADGINKPQELIQTILDGEAPIYIHDGANEKIPDNTGDETVWRKAYKHLMEGVSNMLPFVVAGGILIALSFFWGINAFDPKDPSYNKVAEVLFYFGKISFSMMLPILAGFIGRSIADRPGFIVGMIGGILADPSILGLKSDLLAYMPSGFLGALVAGFLAGGIIQVLKAAFSWMPRSLDGIKPIFLFPILGSLIMGLLMIYVINAPMASVMEGLKHFIESLNGSGKFVLGFVVASMMAIDMGGPINKASYVTGTALVTAAGTAGSDVMAAVMIGGMVPPLAIAVSATINKNIWPTSQRSGALVNYVIGLSFITEGAIPFAASNPARVIPPLFISSGVAGALSMTFGAVSKAPHGGIFAIIAGAVSNWQMYLLALIIASILGAVLLIVSLSYGKKTEK